jgi:hypothetical protein
MLAPLRVSPSWKSGFISVFREPLKTCYFIDQISASVDALGNPVRFILTAGRVHDILQAEDLISGLRFDKLRADRGYDG